MEGFVKKRFLIFSSHKWIWGLFHMKNLGDSFLHRDWLQHTMLQKAERVLNMTDNVLLLSGGKGSPVKQTSTRIWLQCNGLTAWNILFLGWHGVSPSELIPMPHFQAVILQATVIVRKSSTRWKTSSPVVQFAKMSSQSLFSLQLANTRRRAESRSSGTLSVFRDLGLRT